MNPTPEQKKVLSRCCKMLKAAFGGLKRVVFDLSKNEDEPDSIKVTWTGKVE